MATYGFEFRATSIYVTTGANDTYVIDPVSDAYPKTRNGITFGWTVAGSGASRDRTTISPNNPTLSGIGFNTNASSPRTVFRVDLPSTGAWDIRAAFGDQASPQVQYIALADNTTTFATYTNVATNADQYMDAGGTVRTTATDWITNNAILTRTFASTSLFITFGDPAFAATGASTVAFLSVTGGAVAATAVTLAGPAGGVTGVASTNFTAGANGTITGTVVVTPSDSAAGGTFTPLTVSINSTTPTGTFTYTPASVGAKTISVTNNGALTNPANLTYTATAAATGSIYMAASMSGLGSGGRLFQNPLN